MTRRISLPVALPALLCAALVAAPAAEAAIIVDIQQVGPDIVADYAGSFDLTGLSGTGGFIPFQNMTPGTTSFFNLSGLWTEYGVAFAAPGDVPFGDGLLIQTATSSSGDPFGFTGGAADAVAFASGYAGGAISGQMVFAGSDFDSLGLLEGTYVYDAGVDSITVNVGGGAGGSTEIPLPAAAPLMLAGLGGIAALRRRG